jgi:predicted nuclease with TOPRIM domain
VQFKLKTCQKSVACKLNNVNFVESHKKMTEKIQSSLAEIRSVVQQLHGKLSEVLIHNQQLQNELALAKSQLEEKDHAVFSLQTEVESLASTLKVTKERVVEVPIVGKRNEEIDELVKEIDKCIQQLKQ